MKTIADVAVGEELPELAYDVTATTVVLGALATRDWRPMHHDVDFAVNRNGIRNIFLNTPNQQAWFERYLTDWTGPHGRLGRMKFRMLTSVFPDDRMVFTGTVEDVSTDDTGCSWAAVERRAPRRRPSRHVVHRPHRPAHDRRRQPLAPPGRRLETLTMALDLTFTAEQEMLRETVRGVCAQYSPLAVVRELEDDPTGFPPELWKQLGALDLLGLLIPEEHGGSGMTLIEAVVLYEELGRSLAPTPHLVSCVRRGRRDCRRRQRRATVDLAPTDRVGRRHRLGGLARTRGWLRTGRHPAPSGTRRRRIQADRRQTARPVRVRPRPACSCRPALATMTRRSRSSWSIPRPPASR